jgi:16S rRNA (guanine966-N2)-methyltransferase
MRIDLFEGAILRISGGQLKGRKIEIKKVPGKSERDDLRPTSSKVREALFDILRNDIRGSSFLDLFAGTGAVGFEALSRGAARTCFVEHDRAAAKEISQYISKMGLDAATEVFNGTAERFLKRTEVAETAFDIIFADPPYASDEIEKILPLIGERDMLTPGGCLVVEHPSKKIIAASCRTLRPVKNYKYGDTMLTLYRKEP